MFQKIQLSIIIPIYGVEKYISNFLDSLLPQVNNQIECIFVDDGCKDLSITILENKLLEYPQINKKILTQKNKGLSIARNNGMKLVSGEYFTFLDPDDEVSSKYISQILCIIDKNNFDIMHINATRINSKGKKEDITLSEKEGINYNSNNYLINLFNKGLWYAWLRIFNKKYLQILHFEDNQTFEDILSIPLCYESADKIYDLPKNLVKYFYRENSISNSKEKLSKNIESFIFGINLYKKNFDYLNYSIIYKQLILMAMYTLNENSFFKYVRFSIDFKEDRKSLINLNTDLTKKDKFMLEKPIIFYFYRMQSRLLSFKFLKK